MAYRKVYFRIRTDCSRRAGWSLPRRPTAMAANNTRTMAFQIPETLFQRIKTHLERETQRTGRKLTQREFVLGLIEEALEAVEQQADSPEPEEPPQKEAGVGPCEATTTKQQTREAPRAS